jgi:hypothetical protein
MNDFPFSIFERLVPLEVNAFYSNEPGYIECLVTAKSIRKIMTGIYNSRVFTQKIIPIEKLSEEEKIELWEQTKAYAKGRLNKTELIELAKAVWCLANILDKNS